jgi:hypothetical protein
MVDTMKQQVTEAANRFLTHETDFQRMPMLPTPKNLRTMVARLKKKQRKRPQQGGGVPKTYRRRRIKQKGGIVKQRRKPLGNNVPTHYQYYQ